MQDQCSFMARSPTLLWLADPPPLMYFCSRGCVRLRLLVPDGAMTEIIEVSTTTAEYMHPLASATYDLISEKFLKMKLCAAFAKAHW